MTLLLGVLLGVCLSLSGWAIARVVVDERADARASIKWAESWESIMEACGDDAA